MSVENSNTKTLTIKPFLQFAGNKFRLVECLKTQFPQDGKRFIEPFAGTMAVSLNVNYPECIVSDTNQDLILLYQTLREFGTEFIDQCEKMFVPENNSSKAYDHYREEFNTSNNTFRKSVLLVYLNRHCFNGLIRYNSSGKFNTPVGTCAKHYFPRKEMLTCLEKIKNFSIRLDDFRGAFRFVEAGDVVYCDPPYAPLSASANFTAYDSGGFSLKDQIDLAECASKAARLGATVIISNHYNWYTKELYKSMFGAKITAVNVSRTISCKGDNRKAVKEIIAVFKPYQASC